MRKAAIALLLILAAALAAAHLQLPHSTQAWQLDASAAAMRRGERMPVSQPQGDVDVNSGSLAELERLSGVGPALAQAILSDWQHNGDFHYPEDLTGVAGIGEKTLAQMLEQLKLP